MNGATLGSATQLLLPDYYEKIDWNNIWNRKIESGTAFEWATTAAIVSAAKQRGYDIDVPLLTEYNAPDFFMLRNEIPFMHGSQVGNSDSMLRSKPLNLRFLYSLVPKFVFEKDGQSFCLFREGCPYHKIMKGTSYLERTDIIIVPGKPTTGYPRLDNDHCVSFEYDYNNSIISGAIAVKTSPFIPVTKRIPRGGIDILARTIIECSVNKTPEVASEQLQRYESLFSVNNSKPLFCLITGNDLSALPYDTHTIDIINSTPQEIAEMLLNSVFGIIDGLI